MSVVYSLHILFSPTPTARHDDAIAIRWWMCAWLSTRSFVTPGMYG